MALLDLAVSTIEVGDVDELNSLDIGAQRLLGNGIYRRVENDYHPVCIPRVLLIRTAQAFERRRGFGKGRLVEYQLALAAKMPDPSRDVVDAVAKVAFSELPQQSEVFIDEDIRPLARAVLASFGRSAADYAAAAYQQVEGRTSMGTGAAQIAAAGGHPDALQRVTSLINDSLNSVPTGRAIPHETRNRLYELAWAIAFTGDAGRPLIGEIQKIMSRRVESWAPPFGMTELQPKQLCKVLQHLKANEEMRQFSYCIDESVPYEQ